MATQVRKERYASAVRCGAQVAALRKARGWTLKELAEKTGFSPQQIFLVEKGEINTPIETLTRIAEALGVPLSALCADVDSVSDYSGAERRGQSMRVARCIEELKQVLSPITAKVEELQSLVAS
jgi:transcriptional regulator with XRE-family HTH domain